MQEQLDIWGEERLELMLQGNLKLVRNNFGFQMSVVCDSPGVFRVSVGVDLNIWIECFGEIKTMGW